MVDQTQATVAVVAALNGDRVAVDAAPSVDVAGPAAKTEDAVNLGAVDAIDLDR